MSRLFSPEFLDLPTRPYPCRTGSVVAGGAPGSSLFGTPASAPAVGAQLGHYRLCFELGFGGMATVFLARVEGRAGLHRFVALKCLHPDLARQPRFAEMFLNEARIASQVRHANVCSVLDFDVYDGISYMAMEYLPGEPMSALCTAMSESTETLPEAHRAGIAAKMIADACEGLHAAHELRTVAGEPLAVVHRDVSPDNIFVTYDGNVKIVDFGVALSAARRCRTRTGVVRGKFAYLQPEVLKGCRADRRADVWSLGVVLWELLTGKRLFAGDADVDVLRAVSEQKIEAPSTVRQGIPRALDDVVLKALRRDPRQRYGTAREFGRKLNQVLVEQRMVIGLAELAEGMDRLFPEGRARKRQLLEIAEQLDSGSLVRTLSDLRAQSFAAPVGGAGDLGWSRGMSQMGQQSASAGVDRNVDGAGMSGHPAERSLRRRAGVRAAAALRALGSTVGRQRSWKFWVLSCASGAAAVTALVLWTIVGPPRAASAASSSTSALRPVTAVHESSGRGSSMGRDPARAARQPNDTRRVDPSGSPKQPLVLSNDEAVTLPLVLSGAANKRPRRYQLRVRPVAREAGDGDGDGMVELKVEIVPAGSATVAPKPSPAEKTPSPAEQTPSLAARPTVR